MSHHYEFIHEQIIHAIGVSRKYILSALAGLSGISILCTLFLVPHYKVIPQDQICNHTQDSPTPRVSSSQPTVDDSDDSVKKPKGQQFDAVEKDAEEKSGWKRCLVSWLNGIYLVWYGCLHVCVQFFLGTFNSRITRIVGGNIAKVSYFTDILACTQLSSLVIGLVTGGIMVWNRKHTLKKDLVGQDLALAVVVALFMSSAASIVLVAACIVNTENSLYVAILSSEIVRGTLYSSAFALLEISWPATHFGVVYGFGHLAMGLVTFMQHAYIIWALANGFVMVDIWLMMTCIASLSLPIFITIRHLTRHTKSSNVQMNGSGTKTDKCHPGRIEIMITKF